MQLKNYHPLEVFSSEAFLAVNRSLINSFGLVPAAFLSNLIDKLNYFHKADKLEAGGWFFQTHEQQMKQTGIDTLYTLRKCKKLFQERGILHTKWMGQPAKEYYRINIRRLLNTEQLALIDSKKLADMKTIDLGDAESECLGDTKSEDLADAKPASHYIDKQSKYKQTKKKNGGSWDWKDFLPREWLDNTSFQITLKAFTKYRRTEVKKPLNPLRAKKIANKLQKHSIEVAIIALTQSMDNCWTGVFPESIKPSKTPPPNKSTEEILKDCKAFGFYHGKNGEFSQAQFNGVWENIYIPAMSMMSDQNSNRELAQSLVALAEWYERESKKPNSKKLVKMMVSESLKDQHYAARWEHVPHVMKLLHNYVSWLGARDQDWIKDRSTSLFNPDNTIFKKFRALLQEDIGVDILTGETVS